MAQATYYSDLYDCDVQANLHSWDDDTRASLIKGRLRLDAFVNQRVVIRDASLVDGLFFWNLASRSLLEELPLNRIEFAMRNESLAQSIVLSMFNPTTGLFREYLFDSLSEADAVRVKQGLGSYRSKEAVDWRKLPRLFKAFGAGEQSIDRLESGWAHLVELDEKRKIAKRIWSPEFHFKSYLLLLLKGRQENLRAAMESETGREVAKRLLVSLTDVRSDVISGLRRDRAENQDPFVRNDIATIKSWYNAAYNETCAVGNGCDVFEITDVPGSAAITKGQKLYDKIASNSEKSGSDTYFRYPADFVRVLGNIQPGEFDDILKRQKTNLDMWYKSKNSAALGRALDALVEFLKEFGFEDSIIPERIAPDLKLYATVGGTALAILALHQLNRRDIFSNAAKAAVIGLAGASGGLATSAIESVSKRKVTARYIAKRAVQVRSPP